MSPQSSYTDFHIDFGGSSVWYSVVRGEKIFYLIEPTDENLQKYADWSKSPTESETFLGDCVSNCYKMHLREENTVFIPAGWIHAVYTVTDSLVFGGNFLQSMDVDMQLRIYELERLAQVPHKFQFPLFETFHWYAAKTFYEELKECNEAGLLTINPITQQASESILHYMSKWLSADKRYQTRNRLIIPKGFNCEKILRDLSRELEQAKMRCGSSGHSKPPSNSIIASPIKVVLPLDTKHELVQLNNTKIKVKCRRLSSESENKNKDSSVGKGMKLTIKTSLSGCRKPSNNRDLSPVINKKKTSRTGTTVKQPKNSNSNDVLVKQEEPPKITYTLDLEAKRQRFIEPSTVQPVHDEFDNDNNTSSSSTNLSSIPTESHIDMNDSHDNNESLISIADGGLASFVKSSSMNDDYYHSSKESKIKREHSASEKKHSSKKLKSKSSTDTDKTHKLLKKIKTEDSSSSLSNTNRKKLLTSSTTTPKSASASASGSTSLTPNPNSTPTQKKRVSSSTPKKLNPKDHRASKAQVSDIIITGTSLSASREASRLVAKYNQEQQLVKLYSTVGIHPHEATRHSAYNYREQLVDILQNRKTVVALGECGLDYDRNFSIHDDQKRVFDTQLQLACDFNLPLFMHERSAPTDMLSLLANYSQHANFRGVIHCFTHGSLATLQKYLALNLYIGITGWVCDERRGKDLVKLIPHIPLDRLLIESDAPFLLPRNIPKPWPQENEPCYLTYIVNKLAECYSVSPDEIAKYSTENAKKLFNI
ncbi:hypothetical protein I4U23_008428 [Adineta vaga]|nr:hypothetical protein I4U23_008428 [Adineta vaga]